MNKVKWLAILLVIAMAFSIILTACTSTDEPTTQSSDSQTGETPKPSEDKDITDTMEPVTIKGLAPFTASGDAPEIQTWNDQVLWKEVPKKTGVTVEWEHVTGDYAAQLGLVMASGDLPDIMQVTPVLAGQYGVQGALVPLQDLITEYAPNLKKILDENPAIRGQITSPDGNIYFFPRILLDPRTQFFNGWMIRKGWVEEVGKDIPSTIDEVYDVLKAIKEKHPERYPFIYDPRAMIWEFGVGSRGPNQPNDFFIEDNQIKYGPLDPRYKEALLFLNKLYSEGILDSEYLTIGDGWSDVGLARVTQEIGGFTIGSWAGYLTRFNQLLEADGKTPDFVAMAPPGAGNLVSRHNAVDGGCGIAISSSSNKSIEITKMVDYLYGDEGRMLVYFGLEGDTYEIKDGQPVYTDKVMNHPTLGLLLYLNSYVANISTWASVLAPESYVSTLTDPEAIRGNSMAVEYSDDIKPPTLQFTSDESARVQELERDINTYVDENLHAFIMGDKTVEAYDSFIDGLDSIGINELIDFYSDAFNRYKVAIGQ